MPSDAGLRPTSELISIRSLVEELQVRVSRLAHATEEVGSEDLARVLFESERALRAAVRQLARAQNLAS